MRRRTRRVLRSCPAKNQVRTSIQFLIWQFFYQRRPNWGVSFSYSRVLETRLVWQKNQAFSLTFHDSHPMGRPWSWVSQTNGSNRRVSSDPKASPPRTQQLSSRKSQSTLFLSYLWCNSWCPGEFRGWVSQHGAVTWVRWRQPRRWTSTRSRPSWSTAALQAWWTER